MLQRLSNEVPLHRAGLDQVENRPQRPSELDALSGLHVALREVCIVKYENAGNIAVTPEVRRNGHMELRRIQIGQIVEAECRVVAVYTLDLLMSIPRPECPKDEIGPIAHREQSEPVDATVLADPVPNLHVTGMGILGESGGFSLFGPPNWAHAPKICHPPLRHP